jgi:hypothetical protein
MFLGIGGATRVQNSNIDTDASILGHMISFANDPAHGGMPAELYLQNGSSANIFQLSANGAINLSGNSTLSTVVVKNENAFLTINLDNTSTMSAGNIFSGFGTNVQNVVINNSGGTVNLATVQGATLNGTAGLVNFTASGEVNSFNMTGTSTVNVLRGVTVSLTGRDSLQASNFVNHGTILGSDTSATTTLTGFVDNFGTLHTAPSGPTLTTLNIVGTLSNEVGGLVQVDANSRLKVSSVKQIGGSTVVNGTLTATNGVALQGGTLSGTGLVAGTVNNISGIVAPGNSPGTLMISGDYIQQVGGTLQIQIADLTHFDRLIIGGKAHLDGTLDVLLANTFSLNVGDSFTFLSAAGNIDLTDNMFSSFDFTYADGSTLPLGFTWDVIYGINSVSLLWSRVDDPTALAVALMNGGTLPTDLPKLPFGVLSTDIADAYNAYCAANPTVCSGGVTAGQQLDGDYRASGTGLPPTAPVPEPTSILLLGSGAVAALKLRRRK